MIIKKTLHSHNTYQPPFIEVIMIESEDSLLYGSRDLLIDDEEDVDNETK